MDLRVFLEPQNGATFAEQLAVAQAAERLGFDGFFRSDHVLTMDQRHGGLPGPTDSWVTLGAIASHTSRLRLGTLVSSATFRHPSMLAIQVAQVDAMSGGRVELGLGTGWFEAEHTAYGIPFPTRRFGPFQEQLDIVTGLWGTPVGDTFSYAGEHYELQEAPALPKPVQARIPIIVGGSGATKTPRIAARYADEYNAFLASDEVIRERIDRVRAAAETIGRDPDTIHYSIAAATVVGQGTAELARRADAAGSTTERLQTLGLSGSPQQVIDRIGSLRDLGISRCYLQLLDPRDLDHLELIGAEVLPRVAG
ncbi:MAG TPA: LLM class F420-dependent oxidoreductase [Microbacteriaceae bacterium]|nr:LLM class F420-dependent oxidoreductase [Microbacteriaceae bacterium]